MINKHLKEKFPFVVKYFETLINTDKDRFPQAILFEGLDITGQYMLSMELARVLNCEKGGDEDCDCINCNWIRNVKHPAVNVVSPLNFKDDASKTVISINQSKKVSASLNETSDYHRFFIFCDAKIKQPGPKEAAKIKEYESVGINYPEGETWLAGPLSAKIFKAEASNSLLKSIEEPPKRTTFIFLSSSKEDVISTIVSRANVFKLASAGAPGQAGGSFQNVIKNYPDLTVEEALECALNVENTLKAEGGDIFDFLDNFQTFISGYVRANINNQRVLKRFEGHIWLIERAKRRLKASMSTKTVLESLFLDIAGGLAEGTSL